jgi:hypothetical protein
MFGSFVDKAFQFDNLPEAYATRPSRDNHYHFMNRPKLLSCFAINGFSDQRANLDQRDILLIFWPALIESTSFALNLLLWKKERIMKELSSARTLRRTSMSGWKGWIGCLVTSSVVSPPNSLSHSPSHCEEAGKRLQHQKASPNNWDLVH